MKKRFELHLDAAIAIALVFALSLGINYFQYRIYQDLASENYGLQVQGLEDKFNLESMQSYIDKLKEKNDQTGSQESAQL